MVSEKKTDEALVALAQAGDKQATDELISRHFGLVRYCARGFFLIGGETEDLIQEGMLGLYHAIGDYKKREKGRSFKNFAYLCISRRIFDAVKTTSRKKNMPVNLSLSSDDGEWISREFNPEDLLILEDERREVKQKMSRVLSDFEFKVMTMYMDGMSGAEICEVCEKPFKSVDNAIQRSKRKLQKIFKK